MIEIRNDIKNNITFRNKMIQRILSLFYSIISGIPII